MLPYRHRENKFPLTQRNLGNNSEKKSFARRNKKHNHGGNLLKALPGGVQRQSNNLTAELTGIIMRQKTEMAQV